MASAKNSGRVAGVLVLAQMVLSYIWNFVLLAPLSAAPGGLLANAASSPTRVGVWALLGLVMGATSLSIAITAWPVVRASSARLATAMVALATVSFTLVVVQQIGILTVLTLSQSLASGPAPPSGVLETAALVARSIKNWGHFSELPLGGLFYFTFFTALFRERLVPRVFAVAGLVAVALQLFSVTQPFFGGEVIFPLLLPMGLSLLALAVWLLLFGFREPTRLDR